MNDHFFRGSVDDLLHQWEHLCCFLFLSGLHEIREGPHRGLEASFMRLPALTTRDVLPGALDGGLGDWHRAAKGYWCVVDASSRVRERNSNTEALIF